MATNLGIDDTLLRQAVRLGNERTKKATVNEALRDYVQRHQRSKAARSWWTIPPLWATPAAP
jgi:Arc/MetJ family transcription regulator